MRKLSGPGLSPPMTARLAAECAEAIEQMKKIKTFATLQLPFMCDRQLIFVYWPPELARAAVSRGDSSDFVGKENGRGEQTRKISLWAVVCLVQCSGRY